MTDTFSTSIAAVNVNLTSQPVTLVSDLASEVREAFRWVNASPLGNVDRPMSAARIRGRQTTREIFKPENFRRNFDADNFIKALCEFAVKQALEANDTILDRMYCVLTIKERPSKNKLLQLRADGRHVLYRLWSKGCILLPITFTLNKTLTRSQQKSVMPELGRFCLDYGTQDNSDGSTAFRMSQHVTRWLHCTSWLKPEDINIEDAVVFNRYVNDLKTRPFAFNIPKSAPSVRLFLSECLKEYPTRLSYDETDLQRFDLYFTRRFEPEVTLANIEVVASQAKIASHTQTIMRKQERPTRSRGNQTPTRILTTELTEEDANHIFYEIRYTREDWFSDLAGLSFLRNHLSPGATQLWSSLFNAYSSYRTDVRGYEDLQPTKGTLRLLSDYISICLPVCLHRLGSTSPLPSCPREFTRHPYVDSRGEPGQRVLTLREFVD